MGIDDAAFEQLTKREWATLIILQGLLAGGAPVGDLKTIVNTAGELAENALRNADRSRM